MGFRTFQDSDGAEWQAYDVVPRSDEERREGDRRSGEYALPETDGDRRLNDRRVTVGRQPALLARAANGWLCFDRADGTERRRLSPIPEGWSRASDEDLEQWRQEARPAARLSGIRMPDPTSSR
jgi:hypothetical protein